MNAVIGVDGGGTKTRGVLVTADGVVLGEALAGPSNYQVTGAEQARETLREIVAPLAKRAKSFGLGLQHIVFGLAGMDRPRDEAIIRPILRDVAPEGVPCTLVNDTFLILRAGAPDGWGIGIVSGTGSNCVLIDRDGNRDRIGGLDWTFGDSGSGSDIGVDALRAARRGEDGRGPKTDLTRRLILYFDLDRLDDLVDRTTPDTDDPLEYSEIAPIVFAAADAGDAVAAEILEAAGAELALSATTVGRRHFDLDDEVPVIVGGSVFQRGSNGGMRATFAAHVREVFPNAYLKSLDASPVLGAVLLGFDQIDGLSPRALKVLRTRLSDH